MSQTKLAVAFGLLAGAAATAIAIKLRRSQSGFVLDRTLLPDAIHHVVYEYSNLIHSGDYVAYKSPGGPIGVHVGDVFLLNCRKFADFFSVRPNHYGDVRAFYFCSMNPLPRIRLQHQRRWRRAINQNLAHISFDRVKSPIPFYTGPEGSTRVIQLVEELRDAFRLFLNHVDDEYKTHFQRELAERSMTVGMALP
jgi:hypothetical protein